MSIAKIRDGLVEIFSDGESRYIRPTFWERLYLLWVFRNFHRLPLQVLSPGQQQMVERLAQRSQFPLRSQHIDPLLVIGRAEFPFRPGRKPISRVASRPVFERLLATGSGSQPVPASAPEATAVANASSAASTAKPGPTLMPMLVKPAPSPILLPAGSRPSEANFDRDRHGRGERARPVLSRPEGRREAQPASAITAGANSRSAWLALTAAVVVLSAALAVRYRTGPENAPQASPRAVTATPPVVPPFPATAAANALQPAPRGPQPPASIAKPPAASAPVGRIAAADPPSGVAPPERALPALPNAAAVTPPVGTILAAPLASSGIAPAGGSFATASETAASNHIATPDPDAGPPAPRLLVSQAPRHVIYPVFPKSTRLGSRKAEVIVKAVVSPRGTVEGVKVLKGDPALAEAVAGAVKQWQYPPYVVDGQPVPVETTTAFTILGPDAVTVRFLSPQ